MKVLLSAYACYPGGSEPEIGWATALSLSKQHEVWVITRANDRGKHDIEFVHNPKPSSLHFVYYDLPRWASWWKKARRFDPVYYYVWQLGSIRVARRLAREISVDICHHVTGGFDFLPSGLAFAGAPFVWGPVGNEDTHPAIFRRLPFADRLKEMRRVGLRWVGRHLDPMTRLTARRARVILRYTSQPLNANGHLGVHRHKIQEAVQTGLRIDQRYQFEDRVARAGSVTILYAANLIHWKGPRFVAMAFAELAERMSDVRLVVVGDGPLQRSMEETLERRGVLQRVEFLGWLAMDELLETMRSCDVFLYPTYHHGLATVCLQAMALGLPVVCLEGDGIAKAVDTDCGIVVPVDGPEPIEVRIADALMSLCENFVLRRRMALAAVDRVRTAFSYDVMVSRYSMVYQNLFAEAEG